MARKPSTLLRAVLDGLADRFRSRAILSLATGGLALFLLATWLVVSGCPARPSGPPPEFTPQPIDEEGLSPGDLLMRVKLAESTRRIAVAIDSPYRVLVDNREALNSRTPLAPTTLTVVGPGRWDLGGHPLVGQRVELLPASNGALRLGDRRYEGFLRVMDWGSNQLVAVNVVYVEDYVASVIFSEMPSNFGREALRAQAIIARTYGLYQKHTHRGMEWDVSATQSSQVYKGTESADAVGGMARGIAASTEGIVLVWGQPGEEGIFPTFYSSTCGGWSVSVEHVKPRVAVIPPLEGGVKCDFCAGGKFRDWATSRPVRIDKEAVWPALVRTFPEVGRLGHYSQVLITPGRSSHGGRLIELIATGRAGQASMRAEDFRLAVGPGRDAMLSTLVTVRDDGRSLWLSDGHGWGHGMGLCQVGASGAAKAGWSADRILTFYYPGAKFKKAYEPR